MPGMAEIYLLHILIASLAGWMNRRFARRKLPVDAELGLGRVVAPYAVVVPRYDAEVRFTRSGHS